MENEEINKSILNLWEKSFNGNSMVYAPLFYGNFIKNSILFVGLNPSFSKEGFDKILRDTEYENINPEFFYKWSNISKDLNNNISKCIKIEKYAVDKYNRFFQPLKNIANKVNLLFQHVDLFLYRETRQEDFKKSIFKNGKDGEINKFGLDQVDIFKKIISLVQPKIIIVANALASDIIRDQFKNLISDFDNKKGFYWLLQDNQKVPIFFSSMITGGRLDKYSRERLIWHITQAIKNT
ncbi:MAG: hypothetical protein AAB913_03415 [Patescibacteria group bacterium]